MLARINLSIVLTTLSFLSFAQSTKIEFEAPDLYPEGIVFDSAKSVYYVSSVRTGSIGTVTMSGKYSNVYTDSSLKSSFGIKLSPSGDRVWICTGDPSHSKFKDSSTYKKLIRLIGIDTKTKAKVADIDLSKLYNGPHFANDLSIDKNGNIYITDSYSPVIYKVDSKGTASVFAQNKSFGSTGVGLNGIVYHPQGYLLVANNGDGSLLKVDINDPSKVVAVGISQFFPGADGLLLDRQQNLLLVQNKGVNKVFKLASQDNWKTANVIAATASDARMNFPSTITLKNGEPWVLNARLGELSDSTSIPARSFTIQKAELKMLR